MKIKSIIIYGLVCLCLLSGCKNQPEQISTNESKTSTAIANESEQTTTSESEITINDSSQSEQILTSKPETTISSQSESSKEKPPTTTPSKTTQTESSNTNKIESPIQTPTQPPIEEPQSKTGTVKGCVTYQYNETIGTRGDVGADILLIPIDLPEGSLTRINAMAFINFPDECLYTEADGNGNYIIQNVPTGRYVIVIRSKNTRCKGNTEASILPFSIYFNEEGKARLIEGFENYKSNWVTVTGGEETIFNHDFGYTYF